MASSTRMQPTDQMSQGKLQPRPRMTSGALRTPKQMRYAAGNLACRLPSAFSFPCCLHAPEMSAL